MLLLFLVKIVQRNPETTYPRSKREVLINNNSINNTTKGLSLYFLVISLLFLFIFLLFLVLLMRNETVA